jgi:hypothetical protein
MGRRTAAELGRQAPMNGPAPGSRFAAALCLLFGATLVGLGFGIIPSEPGTLHAPPYIIVLAGLSFWIAGIALTLGNAKPRLNHVLAAILLAFFAAIGGWVSLFGENQAFGGSVAMVSPNTNMSLARIVFGIGALLCAALSIYAFKKAIARVA